MTYELLKNFDFSLEAIPISNLGARDDLDCSFLTVFSVDSSTDFTVCSLAKLLKKEKFNYLDSNKLDKEMRTYFFLSFIDLIDSPIVLSDESLLADDKFITITT